MAVLLATYIPAAVLSGALLWPPLSSLPSLHGWLVNDLAYFFSRGNCDRDEAPVYRSMRSMRSFIHHEYHPRPANQPRKGLHLRLELRTG